MYTPLPVMVPNRYKLDIPELSSKAQLGCVLHGYNLDIPELSSKAQLGCVIPGLHQYILSSMPQLCATGCLVAFDSDNYHIFYNKK